jgi:hypothetical protein
MRIDIALFVAFLAAASLVSALLPNHRFFFPEGREFPRQEYFVAAVILSVAAAAIYFWPMLWR